MQTRPKTKQANPQTSSKRKPAATGLAPQERDLTPIPDHPLAESFGKYAGDLA
jgi:hypothetical protein